MSSSYSSLEWILSHWTHSTMRSFICVYVCFLCSSCHTAMHVLYYRNMVGWAWWDWSLILEHLPSVLWHCWFGHLICKNLSALWPIMCLVGHQSIPSCLAPVDSYSHPTHSRMLCREPRLLINCDWQVVRCCWCSCVKHAVSHVVCSGQLYVLCFVEYGLTSHSTHYRSFWWWWTGRV